MFVSFQLAEAEMLLLVNTFLHIIFCKDQLITTVITKINSKNNNNIVIEVNTAGRQTNSLSPLIIREIIIIMF